MQQILLTIEVLCLVGVAAICSGLNIAFMSLSISDLRRKAKLGNVMAKRVLPLRKNSHLTLSSILLGNVAAVAASSILLGDYFSGLIAGLISTLLNVIFGEVLPQALFTRYALRFCSTFVPLMNFLVIFTYPVSKPLQLLLDRLLGHEKHYLHSRGELGMIISEHLSPGASELDEDEVEIMRGALSLSEKRVSSIMTPIKKVYALTPQAIIDAAKIDEIKAKGYSRIPVFNDTHMECLGILLMKDLVDIDFDENPRQVKDLRLYPTKIVGSMTALDTMFRKFIVAKTHLIPIDQGDKIIGIVTIEDLLEEILGHEIEDESDQSRSLPRMS
ncbi:MAG: CNNM domain-containing protein [Patescibacteria group bacterium]